MGTQQLFGYQHSSKISFLIFIWRRKLTKAWDNFRVNKWWQNIHFWLNYPWRSSLWFYDCVHHSASVCCFILSHHTFISLDLVDCQGKECIWTFPSGGEERCKQKHWGKKIYKTHQNMLKSVFLSALFALASAAVRTPVDGGYIWSGISQGSLCWCRINV